MLVPKLPLRRLASDIVACRIRCSIYASVTYVNVSHGSRIDSFANALGRPATLPLSLCLYINIYIARWYTLLNNRLPRCACANVAISGLRHGRRSTRSRSHRGGGEGDVAGIGSVHSCDKRWYKTFRNVGITRFMEIMVNVDRNVLRVSDKLKSIARLQLQRQMRLEKFVTNSQTLNRLINSRDWNLKTMIVCVLRSEVANLYSHF